MWLKLFSSLIAVVATMTILSNCWAQQQVHRALIQYRKKRYGMNPSLAWPKPIKSKEQREWRDVYATTVEVIKNRISFGEFQASTLLNFPLSRGKPEDWKYACFSRRLERQTLHME